MKPLAEMHDPGRPAGWCDRIAGRLDAEPRFVTHSAAGAGFAELAAHLLGAG